VNMGPADVNVGTADMHMAPASGEVPTAEVAAAEVASTKVTASVSATSVSAAPVTASATSKGRCRNCRTAQKDGGSGYEHCFSQHQDLHHGVSSTIFRATVFPSSTPSSGQCLSTTRCDPYNEEIERERFKRKSFWCQTRMFTQISSCDSAIMRDAGQVLSSCAACVEFSQAARCFSSKV
jgi:hypothetical protein